MKDTKQVAAKEAKKAVKQHETKMHAKGGMIARGIGAARKSSGKFTRNG
jgi:hypothetical protein